MKQGRADREGSGTDYGRKVEPYGHVTNVRAVSQIGSALGNHITEGTSSLPRGSISETLYKGKVGFQSPPDVAWDIHKSGSQGSR